MNSILCIAIGALGVATAPTAGDKPNVVLIYTDDHAQWAVGAYGNKDVHTPNMDRLATEGLRFTQGFTKPVCSPSRAMLLSGQYSHRFGIPDYIPYGNPVHIDNGLAAGTPTIASILKRAGYRTGLIGKWHLGYGEKYYPQRFGFDHAEGFRYIAPGRQYQHTGEIPYFVAGKEDHNFRKSSSIQSDSTTILTDRALEFIRTNNAEPFFLFLSYYRPHLRWQPVPEEDFAGYKDQTLTVPDPPPAGSVSEDKLRELMRLYYANITCVDRNIGRVLELLDALSLVENTVVMFIGDNGFMVGQHGLLGKGNARRLHVDSRGKISRELGTRANMFEESILVPFIVRWPGVTQAGTTNDSLVSTLDVLPTLAEMVGENTAAVDGHSLAPLLGGESDPAWRQAYFDTYDMIYLGDNGEKPHIHMIRTDGWKLLLYQDENGRPLDSGERHELFNLRADPGELTNLYDKPAGQPAQQHLAARLQVWMRETLSP